MCFKIKKFKRSLTIVEFMVIIIIVAILSGLIIFVVRPTELFAKIRDNKRVNNIQDLYQGIVLAETWNSSKLDLGSSNYIYLSLPDDNPACTNYSLPVLPVGFSYHCVTDDNLQNIDGAGWIPINFSSINNNSYFSQLPVDPINTADYYYSYSASDVNGYFEINSFFETDSYEEEYANADSGDVTNVLEVGSNLMVLPQSSIYNWIKVPGNDTYGTEDFWVMQYEAKYSMDGRTGSDAPVVCKNDVVYDTFEWEKDGACSQYISTWYPRNVISSPMGSPLAGVSRAEAIDICESIDAHLLTNGEWMTIARNVAMQPSNWTSGTVGDGNIFNGNPDPETGGYVGPIPDKGLDRNSRASLLLSNGYRIFDLAGNVFERVVMDSKPEAIVNNGWSGKSNFTDLIGYTDLAYGLIDSSEIHGDTESMVGFRCAK